MQPLPLSRLPWMSHQRPGTSPWPRSGPDTWLPQSSSPTPDWGSHLPLRGGREHDGLQPPPQACLRGSPPGPTPKVQYGAQPPLPPPLCRDLCLCGRVSPVLAPVLTPSTQAPWGQGAQSNNPAPSPRPGGLPPHDPKQPPPEFTTKIKEQKGLWVTMGTWGGWELGGGCGGARGGAVKAWEEEQVEKGGRPRATWPAGPGCSALPSQRRPLLR